MCGSEANSLNNIQVAGSTMKVCNSCKNMGHSVHEEKKAHTFYKRHKDEETRIEPVENYSSLIERALAKRGLNHQQLARATNIKESNLNKYLSNKLKPDLETIKKIEKFLEIPLTEEVSGGSFDMSSLSEDNESLSLGDLIKKQLK